MADVTIAALVVEQVHHSLPVPSGVGRATDPALLWYLTRTTAVAAYVALTLSVALGMLRVIARTSREHLSWVVDELHTFMATLAGLLVVGHMLSIRFDTYLPFTTANLLFPGIQPYRPSAVNLGIVAFYVLATLLLTSWLRRYLTYGFWRGIHYLSFVAFALVTAHGWMAGSDTTEAWMHGVYESAVGLVGFLVLMRLVSRRPATTQPAQDT
jgi:predicted ferric reductase